MAVTCAMSVKNNEVVAGMQINAVATFANTGASALTISSVNRISPGISAGVIIDDANKLEGMSVPASGTFTGGFSVIVTKSSGVDIYSLSHTFLMSDGTLVTPGSNPQICIRDPNALSTREKFALPVPGSLDFRSNVQSGLAGSH